MSSSFDLAGQLPRLLPLAAAWVEKQEARIVAYGVALTAEQISDARKVGVNNPERVRLLSVASITAPEHPMLRAAAEATQLIGPGTAGLTLRYGIFIRQDCWGDRHLVAHELVHTGQYERFGSIAEFLRHYLEECLTVGYPEGPLEQEAIVRSGQLFFRRSE